MGTSGFLLILMVILLLNVLLVALMLRAVKGNRSSASEVREELRHTREESRGASRELREEVAKGLRTTAETMTTQLMAITTTQQQVLGGVSQEIKELAKSNHDTLERVRTTLHERVSELQLSNEAKLDEMRKTVDEKLHDTLEKRLGESFKLVSDRLEAVHKGLGEMQNLATGVGDLKRVLTNVKARGTWAEVQLGALLDQVLSPHQFERNVRVKPESNEQVEFAIRLPGPKDDPDRPLWLPIDSKFPQEDYLRLQEAADKADAAGIKLATEALERTVRTAAREIHDKYINPPETTDFAIMFLATEGLYAEVLRQPALVDELQQRLRIVVAGPTTLGAILNSLRMGFQTLAIEQRASDVWRVLGAVKTEFGKFGDVLSRVKKQLDTASRTIDETGVRTRALERRLRSVEELPEQEAASLLQLEASSIGDEELLV